ncbi:MAG TPA: CBS domain-containing protein [Chloroflexota bacterium]|nr:CBS domain-containing protein [Chloroflexota bacterium]
MPFLYLSQVVGRPVCNDAGERIAIVKDLVARLEALNAATGEVTLEHFPPISGLVVHLAGGQEIFVSWSKVASLTKDGARLSSATLTFIGFRRREGEVLLARDLLDKQLIDVDGRRVIRANDLQLLYSEDTLRLIGVDISLEALARRLTWGRLFAGQGHHSRISLPSTRGKRKEHHPVKVIAWADIDPLTAEVPDVRLRLSHERLALLNPVDIAHIIDDLSYQQGAEIIESLDDETAAETLQEVEDERQADIVEEIDQNRAADILQEMDPDNAADLLQDLDELQRKEFLDRMDHDDAEDVRELMAYGEDTAGGIMTTDFVTAPPRMSVDETIAYVRRLEEAPDVIEYLYVVEERVPAADWARADDEAAGRLLGIVSLRDLLLAPGDTPLTEIMDTDLVWVYPEASKDEAARTMAEYNLIALPVLDDEERMVGVITVDDAMEVLLPERWSRRLPHVFS